MGVSQIRVPTRGPKSGSQMGVSQIEVQNRGPKWGSQMVVSHIEVQNQGPKCGSQIRVPKPGSHNWGPISPPKLGSQIGVPNWGPKRLIFNHLILNHKSNLHLGQKSHVEDSMFEAMYKSPGIEVVSVDVLKSTKYWT
jgi:hypothetical protein